MIKSKFADFLDAILVRDDEVIGEYISHYRRPEVISGEAYGHFNVDDVCYIAEYLMKNPHRYNVYIVEILCSVLMLDECLHFVKMSSEQHPEWLDIIKPGLPPRSMSSIFYAHYKDLFLSLNFKAKDIFTLHYAKTPGNDISDGQVLWFFDVLYLDVFEDITWSRLATDCYVRMGKAIPRFFALLFGYSEPQNDREQKFCILAEVDAACAKLFWDESSIAASIDEYTLM